MRAARRWSPALFAAAALLGGSAVARQLVSPARTPDLLEDAGRGLFEVRSHWQHGELVVLVRHTERCDHSDTPCWQGDKGITMTGRDAAIALGEALRGLPPQPATVYHSPALRTAQTAALAFPGLSASAPWLGRDCRENLYRDILRVKEPGANLILVTHSTCMGELHDRGGKPLLHIDFHDARSYGLAAFVAVDQRQGTLYPIGLLRLDEWPAARARLKP